MKSDLLLLLLAVLCGVGSCAAISARGADREISRRFAEAMEVRR